MNNVDSRGLLIHLKTFTDKSKKFKEWRIEGDIEETIEEQNRWSLLWSFIDTHRFSGAGLKDSELSERAVMGDMRAVISLKKPLSWREMDTIFGFNRLDYFPVQRYKEFLRKINHANIQRELNGSKRKIEGDAVNTFPKLLTPEERLKLEQQEEEEQDPEGDMTAKKRRH
ncbi:hypothetical protein SEMRO_784_G202020.1 [Seminavis robusta]|uniref:Uncharacterized protein n=1 Tax=Seminavis robusta TaxID=568900 RepID=A0A9N8E9U5_9STRA|nr:hypothetical protein SEMRO_784_G202020.1 [Seminavis robusta]|eukprot:Sro784_g202020.1 n/a (170) ;mRNA; f:26281-26790